MAFYSWFLSLLSFDCFGNYEGPSISLSYSFYPWRIFLGAELLMLFFSFFIATISLNFFPYICRSGESKLFCFLRSLSIFFFSGVSCFCFYFISLSRIWSGDYGSFKAFWLDLVSWATTFSLWFSDSLWCWLLLFAFFSEVIFLASLFRLYFVFVAYMEISGKSSSEDSSIFFSFCFLVYVSKRPRLPKKLLYRGNINYAIMLPSTVYWTSVNQCWAIC